MPKIIFLLLFGINVITAFATIPSVHGRVIEKESNDGIPFAKVIVEYYDSVIGYSADSQGIFSFTPRRFPLTLKIGGFGMEETKMRLTTPIDTFITVILSPTSIMLNEVEITGRLTNLTNYGLSYNMAANKRAQSENILQSLSYVPLVDVDVEGNITVRGSSSFRLYLNGRPYEMAQTSPKMFLESLSASTIDKVEVITHPNEKYGMIQEGYILNIVLKRPLVEGYTFNIAGSGKTQPGANGSILGMVKKNKVIASVTYDYNLNSQRNQPMDVTYTENDSMGNVSHIWNNTVLNGRGNWHTHTMRAMMKWNIDSVNNIYIDINGRIKNNYFRQNSTQSEIFPESEQDLFLKNVSEYTSGTTEANMIYRNYFRNQPQSERFIAGYRFTYNPDKRHLAQNRESALQVLPSYTQCTDGGMAEHSAMMSFIIKPSPNHRIQTSANYTHRRGKTDSHYFADYADNITDNSMRYNNNLSSIDATYSGWIKRLFASISAKVNYDYFTMRLPESPTLDYKRDKLYFLPSASLFWRPNDDNALYLIYSTKISRPSIEMLNPYESSTNDHSVNMGNPDLKAQYTHSLSLSWYSTKIRNLTLSTCLEYTDNHNVILPYSYVDAGRQMNTYSNFGHSQQFEILLNSGWTPRNWISISLNTGIGNRHLKSRELNLTQNNIYYRITPSINWLLPNNFRIGGKYGLYKNLPNPCSYNSTLTSYSFYVSKSFIKGRLSLTVSADSPFNKYHHRKVVMNLPTMHTEQNNYITARSFGVRVSYSFGGGHKVDIQRDRSLNSTDQATGVQ